MEHARYFGKFLKVQLSEVVGPPKCEERVVLRVKDMVDVLNIRSKEPLEALQAHLRISHKKHLLCKQR